MVNTIPFIDMRRSPEDSINCWIVYLLPFNKQTHIDDDTIYALQQACILTTTSLVWDGIWEIRCLPLVLLSRTA